MRIALNSKVNNTENTGPEPQTNPQWCREYRQRQRKSAPTTQVASDEPGSNMDVHFIADGSRHRPIRHDVFTKITASVSDTAYPPIFFL